MKRKIGGEEVRQKHEKRQNDIKAKKERQKEKRQNGIKTK